MSLLRIYLLGSPRCERDDEQIQISRRKGMALLAYLAVTGQPQQRDSLAALLWPVQDDTGARSNLRRELSRLRQTIGDELITVEGEQIGLSDAPGWWLDVASFQEQLDKWHGHEATSMPPCYECAAALTKAVTIYTDDFMTGFSLPDCPAFEEWQFFEAESLRRRLAEALQALSVWHGGRGEFERAVELSRRWLALDPLYEPAHRQLMRLYAWSGRRAAALRQYQECTRLLSEELGIRPEPETTALHDAIKARQLEAPRGSAEQPPGQGAAHAASSAGATIKPQAGARNNLPAQATSFVGRRTELAEIGRLLREEPDCRLLTLVGPGGIGKTRLAIEAANEARLMFGDGVSYVPLASVNPALFEGSVNPLVTSIADALEVVFHGGRAHELQLLEYLRERDLLLVLDNFEQLMETAGFVAQVLLQTKRVKILVTSRERLNLQMEWLFPVQGLNVPPDATQTEPGQPVASIEQYSAARLFEQRARLVQPGFDMRAEEKCVGHICRLVEGMPLGIELAAAWVRMMPCEAIADEIESNTDFLTTQLRDIPPRHRSLRAVFEHSWALLTQPEKEVLRNLSIFRGGFDIELAADITGASLAELSALVDKSLLQISPAGRYYLHELLRQFAAEKLHEEPESSERIHSQHAESFLALLHAQEQHLKSSRLKQALVTIAASIDDIRAAWNWSLEQARFPQLKRALESLWLFFEIKGWHLEADEMFGQTLAKLERHRDKVHQTGSTHDTGDYRLLTGQTAAAQGWFRNRLGHYRAAKALFLESLAILRPLGEDASRDVALGLMYFGISTYIGAEPAKAISLLRESLARFRELDDLWAIGHNLVVLGQATWELGNLGDAEKLSREGIDVLERVGDQRMIAYAMSTLGRIAQQRGENTRAKAFHRKCLAVRKEIGDRTGTAFTYNDLGEAARIAGDAALAEDYYRQCEALAKEIGLRLASAIALLGLGKVALLRRDYVEAKRLFEQSLSFSEGASVSSEAEAVVGLGWAALGLGEFQDARHRFYVALREGAATKQLVITADAAAGLAHFLARIGQAEQALELTASVLVHPAANQETKGKLVGLQKDLSAALPGDVVVSALGRGRSLSVETLAAELLAMPLI